MSIRYFSLLFLIIFCSNDSFSQIKLIDDTYQTFDGRKVNVWLIEGQKIVLNIDKTEITKEQLADTTTLFKILDRTDKLYNFYLKNMGFEPTGGNSKYSNKCDVFFGNPSCGSGCGRVGAKGLEASGFKNIYFNLKYNLNVNRDVIIGYELGRNFFTFSDKFLFPFDLSKDEKNGGFAEGFAALMNQYAYEEAITEPSQVELNEILINTPKAVERFRGYINDTTATPYNCLAKWDKLGIVDPNRGGAWHGYTAYDGHSILTGIFETLDKKLLFPKFFQILRNRPSVKTTEDALSNIAYSASVAMNQNLGPFFKNVLKFKITSDVESFLNTLPNKKSFLIKDEPILWFLSPFEKINLNLRSSNYLEDNAVYKLVIDGKIISENKNGNNVLIYELLKGEVEKEIFCQLFIDGIKIDEFKTLIKKRHNIKILDYKNEFYAAYLSNIAVKSSLNNKELFVEHLQQLEPLEGLVLYQLNYSRDRVIQLKGKIRNIYIPFEDRFVGLVDGIKTSGFSRIDMISTVRYNRSSSIGVHSGIGDNQNYYEITLTDSTNAFFLDKRNYFLGGIHLTNYGYGIKSYFKDVIIYDITDTDKDGLIDFEDDCPLSPAKPTLSNASSLNFCSGQNVVLTSSGTNNQWYLNDKIISNSNSAMLTVTTAGVYQVKSVIGNCSSPLSTALTVVVNPPPPIPTITLEANGGLTSSANEGNQWYFNDVKIDNATQKTIIPTKSGNYTVRVLASPCDSEFSKPYNLIITGTEEKILSQVQISPNPFINQFKVSFPNEFGKTAQVKILDLSGKVLFKKASVIDGEVFEIGNINEGNYILHLNSNENSKSKVLKISKSQ
jgi:hypothetical protein